mgnify:CR=1 FL=1
MIVLLLNKWITRCVIDIVLQQASGSDVNVNTNICIFNIWELIYEKEDDKNDNNEAADDREMKKWSALQTHF